MTPLLSARSLALAAGATALALLLAQPAQAHGIAQGGTAAGFFHPISGVAAGLVVAQQLPQSRISLCRLGDAGIERVEGDAAGAGQGHTP